MKRTPASPAKHKHGPACRPNICDEYAKRLAAKLRHRNEIMGQIESPANRVQYLAVSMAWGSGPAFDSRGNWLGIGS